MTQGRAQFQAESAVSGASETFPGERQTAAEPELGGASGPKAAKRLRAARRPALERREEFVTRAAAFFAQFGFAGSTRALADQLGVRQALLYRYFPSKDALVEAVFARIFSEPWGEDFAARLADRREPLEDRLTDVYQAYAARDHGLALRLFIRAALDGHPVPQRRGAGVTEQIVTPLVEELRHEARLPDLARLPMLKSEREMVMMLHASVVFHGVREHIYRLPVAAERDEVMKLYCATFLAGAREQIRRLHKRPPLPAAATKPASARVVGR
jgi:AcrR family transcriptional regulator